MKMFVFCAGLTLTSSAILRVDLSSTLQPAILFELALGEHYSENIPK